MKIPLRYENVSEEDIPKKLLDIFKEIKVTRKGLYIHGSVGTGKTHLMYALGKYAERNLIRDVEVFNSTDMLRRMRDDFAKTDSYDKEHLFKKLLEFRGLLMIDDIGAEKLSDWVLETFYLLINKRYEEMMPTLFTSNLPLKDLADKIGDRTVSRIVESCDVYNLDGDDRRIKQHKKI
jgi:DNA replication protein DnaC